MLSDYRSSAPASELILKTIPPRVPRDMVLRARLSLSAPGIRDCRAVVVEAPAGFGKTALLAQWQREAQQDGTTIAWLAADQDDHPQRFLQGLVQALRTGCALPDFAHQLTGDGSARTPMDGITSLLAEIAASGIDILLMVDDAARLPASSGTLLAYLLHNTPPNLQIVVAGRGAPLPLLPLVRDLQLYGQCAAVGIDALRLTYEETRSMLVQRYGASVDDGHGGKLHELAQGWPLGTQLALSGAENERQAAAALAGGGSAMQERVLGLLLARLAEPDIRFLVAAALTDTLHPDLCRTVTMQADAPQRLARLAASTPLFVQADDGRWYRLHAMVRELLRVRLRELDPVQVRAMHLRAADWLLAHGSTLEAARHALAGGAIDYASDLAEQSLVAALRQGDMAELERWRAILPEAEVARRPRLALSTAWIQAMSEHHADSAERLRPLLDDADGDSLIRFECTLVAGAAALYADDIDRFVALHEPWVHTAPPVADPWLMQARVNRLALTALYQGAPAQARRHLQQGPLPEPANAFVRRVGEIVSAFSYIREGQHKLALTVLTPALSSADAALGRRHSMAAMLAALMATVRIDCGDHQGAQSVLANRLDVLERTGSPDFLILAYQAAARSAAAQGLEHRSHDLLEALYACGLARALPRVCLAASTCQMRLHAARGHAASARALLPRLLPPAEAPAPAGGPLLALATGLERSLGLAYAAIACGQWSTVSGHLDAAGAAAETLGLTRARIEIIALRGLARVETDGLDGGLIDEARDLAASLGLGSMLAEIHPRFADSLSPRMAPAAGRPRPADLSAHAERLAPGTMLTPKERQILDLLVRSMTNKEMAAALAVGDETIKWHMKNLFSKLDAASRKHAVQRAHVLGLFGPG